MHKHEVNTDIWYDSIKLCFCSGGQ